MKKWNCCLYLLLPFFGWSEPLSNESDLTAIEQEIQMFKNRLQDIQTKEMNEQVQGQGLMIGDWDAYAKELMLVREQENEEKKIQLKIQQLEERKAELIKTQSQSQ